MSFQSTLLMPSPWLSAKAFYHAALDPQIHADLLITLWRIFLGFLVAVVIGLPLGFVMGYSRTFLSFLDPLITSLRQIPIMAWVPLAIIWFGLGNGPTIFLIAFAGIFPMMLSVVAGVQDISTDYYNAARSMGASNRSILIDIVLPSSLPSIMTGMRLALSAGWMSVI
ncbi:ABC transporter permease [Desulfonatronum sp. SC1]|nr:ABC transporter permease [Desulfonatronum sp. SC1]